MFQEKLDDEYHQKIEQNKRKAEEKTAKKRAKRLKKKKNAKLKEKNPKVVATSEKSSECSDTEEKEHNNDTGSTEVITECNT